MVGRKVPEATRREEMLRAAYDVAARQGLEALTLRSVAARADVSHGTVTAAPRSCVLLRFEAGG